MREIKFRFWDANRECMVDWNFIKDAPMTHLEMEVAFIPMQYTGLKGKDGKEIYEGDILSYAGNKAIVIFENGAFRTKYKLKQIMTPVLQKQNQYQYEVIGNIYEK